MKKRHKYMIIIFLKYLLLNLILIFAGVNTYIIFSLTNWKLSITLIIPMLI